ncbi:hypothetical protein D521_1823 [beta proteobacterium CB]|nr:hypothetical protein D521_1823 [beta proteobacterium CB]
MVLVNKEFIVVAPRLHKRLKTIYRSKLESQPILAVGQRQHLP